jgi:hypothetical protein
MLSSAWWRFFESTSLERIIGFENVKQNPQQGGEVLWSITASATVVIFPENGVQDPVALVFNTPVSVDKLHEAHSLCLQTPARYQSLDFKINARP